MPALPGPDSSEVNLRRELDHPRKVFLRLRQHSERGVAEVRVRRGADRSIGCIERLAAELQPVPLAVTKRLLESDVQLRLRGLADIDEPVRYRSHIERR